MVSGAVDVVQSVYQVPISHTGRAMMLIEPRSG
jgi:hypothetical protein